MKTIPPPARVSRVRTTNIEPNPHNPRRLFDPEPMSTLKESISDLGILVPLDVYPKDPKKAEPRKDTFVLLDGERRWRCACELKLSDVPVIIVETPDDTRNILTMFHIHNVREGWQMMPTAMKLETLMKSLNVTNERKLAELTKLTLSTIRRCKILLTYPKRHQLMMLAPPHERYKADFFIDLQRIRGPAIEDRITPWVSRGDAACIDLMIAKYDSGVIKAVTEFRELASLYRGAQRVKKERRFEKELERFFSDPNMRIADMGIPGASFEKEIKEIGRSYRRLSKQISDIDFGSIAYDKGLISGLRALAELINKKLEEAFLGEERDV